MKKKAHKIFVVVAFLAAVPAAGFLVAVGLGKANVGNFVESVFAKTEANMASKSIVGCRDIVTIEFSRSANAPEVEKKFEIVPHEKISLNWSQDGKRLEIKPVDFFKPGEQYELKTSIEEGIIKKEKREFKFSFSVEDYPRIVGVVPGKEDSSNVSVSSDIKVVFDKPAKGYNIDFAISPFENFKWEADGEKKEFRIFPQDKLKYETEYEMKITTQVAIENVSAPKEEIFSGKFKTEKKPYVTPPRDTSAVIPEDQVVDHEARVSEGKYIDINLAKQHLSIFEDGKRLGTYRISTGKRGMATPTGNFKVLGKRGRAWSNKYKLYMPYFMQFTGVGHGIHELPEWPGGYKEGAAHLGTPVSHGCVRLGVGPAASIYSWAEIGTPVVVHY
ncbi:MAG: L,D-transpeptidase [Patescibacteria group bacterium]|nr:L,D-transpeptidase [Patescibacteria group bacterium]